MDSLKILAIALIVAGSLGLIYGGFTYTKDTQQAKIGPLWYSSERCTTVWNADLKRLLRHPP